MDTKTPPIPLKPPPEKPQPRKHESAANVFLPPLLPSCCTTNHQQHRSQYHRHHRTKAETLWPRDTPCGSRFQGRPYRVLQIGATPLMHACQQADRTRVLRLLDEQENTIGYRDRTLRNALHYCMDAGTAGAVAAAAPDLVNSRDAEGHTPLHLAVIAGDTQLVAVLLANGADVNAKDLEGHSVLHWATVCGEAECVRLILAAGARPSTADLRGSTPLHYAAQCCGATATADLAVPKKIALNVLQTLLEFGAKVDAKDEDGRRPIMWAAGAGSVEAVLALARAGGTVAAGASDKDGLTALHCAASRGHARCIEALVNLCGAELDHVDDIGCSALHYAATLGHADATALMLKLGADPNRQDRKGRTAALCAAAKGQLETLKILAQNGASLHARTVRGTGLAHEAASSGRVELINWLARRRLSLLDVAAPDGKTPLHVAALHGHIDVCKALLDHGIGTNPILISNKGNRMTPLDAALHRGHRSCAKLIQMHGGTTAHQIATQTAGKFIHSSAKQRTKHDLHVESSSDSDDRSPRRRRRKYRGGPGNYYEERWFERRTRKRNGSSFGTSLSRQDSRSFSEEEIRLSTKKSFFRKDRQRRARSESARNDGEESVGKKVDKRGAGKKRYEGVTEDDYYKESVSSDPSHGGEHPKRNTNVTEGNGSVSEDSLEEVVVVKKSSFEKKSEKIVSGRHSRSTNSTRKDGLKNEPTKVPSGSIDIATTTAAEKSYTANPSALDNKDDRPTTDSTSQEAVERVVVKAIVHKDQPPDTPNLDQLVVDQASSIKDDEKANKEDDSGIVEGAERSDDALLTKVLNLKKDVELMRLQKSSSQLAFQDLEDDGRRRSATSTNVSKDQEGTTIGGKSEKFNNSSMSTSSEAMNYDGTISTEEATEKVRIDLCYEPATKSPLVIGDGTCQVDPTDDRSDAVDNEPRGRAKKSSNGQKHSAEMSERFSTKDLPVINGEHDKSATTINPTSNQSLDVHVEQKGMVVKHPEEDEDEDEDEEEEEEEEDGKTTKGPADENERTIMDSARGKSADSSDYKDSDVQIEEEENVGGRNESGHLRRAGNEPATKSYIEANCNGDKDNSASQTRCINERSARSVKSCKSSRVRRSSSARSSAKISPNSTESLEEGRSPDGSAIVAVIGSPAWDEEEVDREIRGVIGEENAEHSTEPEDNEMGIIRVLPSTSEDEPLVTAVTASSPRIGTLSRRIGTGTTKVQNPVDGHTRLRREKQQRRDSAGRDSGIEPSPRVSRIPRRRVTTKCCPITEKQQALDMESITRDVQINLRRYHLERKIFFQLMELKRLQIRHGRANEHVLVKRQVEAYNRTGMSGPILGVARYDHQPFTFRHFETFLYGQLRRLQQRQPPSTPDFCTEAKQCTERTHRCHHATSAYTSTPAYTYLGGSVPERRDLLPKIEDRGRGQMTVELTHGEEKQVIALPAERLDRTKRYFVTFTVRGEDRDVEKLKSTCGAQRNAKSV